MIKLYTFICILIIFFLFFRKIKKYDNKLQTFIGNISTSLPSTKLSYTPSIITFARRIIIIGDLHGDFDVAKKIFKLAKLIKKIDGYWKWIGKDTHVVQIGDQIDYGGKSVNTKDNSQELKLLNFMDILHLEAQEYGGAVISLLGNHEIMNVMGIFDYVTPNGIREFGGINERRRKFAPGGVIATKFAYNRPAILKIGDYIFVHGGINPYWANKYSITKMNYMVRQFLLGKVNIDNNQDYYDFLTSETSIFWTRMFSSIESNCKELDETLNILNAKKIFVAHTIQNKITSKCNNKLYLLDVGLSSALGSEQGKTQVLEILHNKSKKLESIKIIS